MQTTDFSDHELIQRAAWPDGEQYRAELKRRFSTDDGPAITQALDFAGHLPEPVRKRFWADFKKGARPLPTRISPKGRFQIKVDGRWRQNKRWWDTCFSCQFRNGEDRLVILTYFGLPTGYGTFNFWGICPVCGERTAIEWIGKPVESRGHGHGHLRARRARSGY